VRTDGDLCSGGLEKERYFGAAAAQLHRWRCPVATLCLVSLLTGFVSLLHWQKKEKKAKDKKGKGKKENRGKEKNRLSNFLEIVIDNLYLLYYYRVIKIEDINYTMK
jgi:hypothetical protein